jgi:hypothetical protein
MAGENPAQPLFKATYAALQDVFKAYGPLLEFVRIELGEELSQITSYGAGASGLTLRTVLLEIVSWADARDKLPDVVRALHRRPGQRPSVLHAYWLAFPDELGAASAPSALACPYDASIVAGSLFIDRDSLRATLRMLATTDGGPRLLVVTGPPCSGKTHSYLLLQYGAPRYQYQTAFVDVATVALDGGGPEGLIEHVVSNMGLDVSGLSVPGEPPTARTTSTLAFRAVGLMRKALAEGRWWVVFDSLDRQTIPPATLAAVISFATTLLTNLSNVNVCLLGYKGALVPPTSSYVKREPLAPMAPIGPKLIQSVRKQMEEYFSVVLRGRDPTIGPDTVRVVVDRVLQKIPANGDMLCALQELANETVARMFAEDGSAP